MVLHRYLKRYADYAYVFLRVLSGLMFSFHGMQKLFGLLAPKQPAFGTQIWFGGVIELVAGLAIAIGLYTSCAAFVASGTMAVAYFQFHWRFQFGSGFLPAINKGELAALYSAVFLYIACRGAGPLSIDARRSRP